MFGIYFYKDADMLRSLGEFLGLVKDDTTPEEKEFLGTLSFITGRNVTKSNLNRLFEQNQKANQRPSDIQLYEKLVACEKAKKEVDPYLNSLGYIAKLVSADHFNKSNILVSENLETELPKYFKFYSSLVQKEMNKLQKAHDNLINHEDFIPSTGNFQTYQSAYYTPL